MRPVVLAVLVSVALTGCQSEPTPGESVSYQYEDPLAAKLETWKIYPGSTNLPEQRDLMVSAKRLQAPDVDPGLLLILDSEASLEDVVDYYAAEYRIESASRFSDESGEPESRVYLGEGDFASEEAELTPLLDELGVEVSRGTASGTYRKALIRVERGPTISLQRPYRDFLNDRVVDRTLIMIVE